MRGVLKTVDDERSATFDPARTEDDVERHSSHHLSLPCHGVQDLDPSAIAGFLKGRADASAIGTEYRKGEPHPQDVRFPDDASPLRIEEAHAAVLASERGHDQGPVASGV